jgi:single-strand DNA-binding protein
MLTLQVIGNIGKDAEIKEGNGQKFVVFSLAVNKRYTNSNGQKVDRTEWISCSTKSLNLCQYLTKGAKIFASGSVSVELYKDSTGTHKAGLKMNCFQIELLSSTKADTPNTTTTGAVGSQEFADTQNFEDVPY